MAPSRTLLYFVFAFVFVVAQLPAGCQAGLKYSQPFPEGEFAVCEPCWLGRGKCRRLCAEDEQVAGGCKPGFFCCRHRVR